MSVSKPVYPGTTSHGAAYKQVQVLSVNPNTYRATVIDQLGKQSEIRYDIIRAKGNPPAPGEMWLVDRMYGFWTFGAIMNGGLTGVVIPLDNVTNLNVTLDDHQNQIIDQVNATTGQIAAKGDILAGVGPGQVTRQPPGVDGAVPVYMASSPTGLIPRVPLALTGPLPGATTPVRYVGGTGTGPPTTGAFVTGDHITTADGSVWICVTGGSPGTWVQPPPGAGTVDGTKIARPGGNATLVSAPDGAGIKFASGIALATDGTGNSFGVFKADSFTVAAGNNATLGSSTGNAAFLSPVDGAGIKFASGTVLATDGPGTGFGILKAQSLTVAGAGNSFIGQSIGGAAFLSAADNAGIKFSGSTVLAVTGDGAFFQTLKAYSYTISSANNATIGLNGPNCAFLSPVAGDNAGIKFGSSIVLLVDGTGAAFGPGKCTVMTQISSGRLKEQIRPFHPHHSDGTFTDIVKSVRTKRYKFTHEVRSGGGPNGDVNDDHIGFIAEELYRAHPDLVLGDLADPESIAIAPTSLIAVLWEMNKELVARIERLESGPVNSSTTDTK